MQSKAIIMLAFLLHCLAVAGCSALPTDRRLTWELTLECSAPIANREQSLRETIRIIENRLNTAGLTVFQVRAKNNSSGNQIIVRLPDVADRERLKKLITTQGSLELAHVISPASPAPVETYSSQEAAKKSLVENTPTNRSVLPYPEQHRFVVLEAPPVVVGSEIRSASAVPDGASAYHIVFSLNPSGAQKLSSWTGNNINEYLAVVYNDEVRSIAFIKSQISDTGQIDGRFSKDVANDVAQILNAGPLPVPLRIVAEGPR